MICQPEELVAFINELNFSVTIRNGKRVMPFDEAVAIVRMRDAEIRAEALKEKKLERM
jgi:hypothetical protein